MQQRTKMKTQKIFSINIPPLLIFALTIFNGSSFQIHNFSDQNSILLPTTMAITHDNQAPGDLGYNEFPISLFYLSPVNQESIGDHSVGIVFKNMMKKNSVTREKGLAEFLKLIQSDAFDIFDYNILVCWLQIFPRMAIDASKTVRTLAIQVQALYVEKYGAKEFSRYFKSSLPAWLNSLFDERSIALVARNSLLSCFGEPEKVDIRIWVIFHEQIVNYCHSVLVHETFLSISDQRYENIEELVLKYNRVVTSALLMLTKLVTLSNRSIVTFSESSIVKLEGVLASEKVWDLLELCLKKDSMSMPLFKTLLNFISVVFTLDENKEPSTLLKTLVDLRSVYKVISKKFIKHVKLDASQNSRVMYSSVILSLLDSLSALTAFSSFSSASKKQKLKKNFWAIGGSKSFSRFRDYVKLGPCNSHPTYYDKLGALFVSISLAKLETTDEFQFLDFSNPDHAKSIVKKSLLPQLDDIRGYDSLLYKSHFVKCIATVISLFTDGCGAQNLMELSLDVTFRVLDSICAPVSRPKQQEQKQKCMEHLNILMTNTSVDIKSLGEILVSNIGLKEPVKIDKNELSSSPKNLCITFHDVLNGSSSHQKDFVESLLEKTEESYEQTELEPLLQIISHVIRNNTNSIQYLMDWVPSLPSLVTDSFVDLPLEVFEALLSRNLDIDYQELFTDFFTKISTDAPSHTKNLILLLSQSNLESKVSLEESFPEAHAYLVTLSQKDHRLKDEDEVVFSYINDEEIFQNLLLSGAGNSGSSKLIEYFVKRGKVISVEESENGALADLLKKATASIEQDSCKKFLQLFEDKDLIRGAVFSIIQTTTSMESLVLFLSENESYIPFEQLESVIYADLGSVDLRLLALANPLGHGIVFIDNLIQKQLTTNAAQLASFLALLLLKIKSTKLLELGAVYAEYLQDFEFLANESLSSSNKAETETELDTAVWKNISITEDQLVALANGGSTDSVLDVFAGDISGKGPFNEISFYHARIISRAFRECLENASQPDFEALEIRYTALVSHPLRLATILSSCSNFIQSLKKLDRIRTYVFSEILGVRSSEQILTAGIQWVALSTYFIDTVSYESILASHKMAMLFNQIWDWLNSDIAFDTEFLPMRYLLTVFFEKLIGNHAGSIPEKAWEIALDLCVNNLSTAQVEQNTLTLRYVTMKMFLMILKHVPGGVKEFEESKETAFEELLAIMTDKSFETESLAAQNRPVFLGNELMERIFTRNAVPSRVVTDKVHLLYETLVHSKFVDLQRTAAFLLEAHILESQQDVVVEYQLRKSKLGDSAEEEPLPVLPQSLIDVIAIENNKEHLEDLLERGSYDQVFRYVWSWLLIFKHFQDTTFNIKLGYINQIKGKRNLEFLFDTVFDTIWPGDINFLNKLVLEPVEKGAKVSPDNCLIQNYNVGTGFLGNSLKDEAHFALVHLYYQSFQFLGSYVQLWYNNIRDLHQKQQINKFSTNYISPLLVTKMLDEVELSKNKLTSMDDNLTVRVNRVTNEIKSTYIIDEQTMEMVVKIPHTYPLLSVTVEGPLRLGVKESQWKAWLLASQRVISLTNGSIIDSIELFNRNVNLHFSGFVECAICYSILHQDHSLPSKVCPTCLNKFHSACLYKWFKSSGSSTCPLCRCTFNFKLTRA